MRVQHCQLMSPAELSFVSSKASNLQTHGWQRRISLHLIGLESSNVATNQSSEWSSAVAAWLAWLLM